MYCSTPTQVRKDTLVEESPCFVPVRKSVIVASTPEPKTDIPAPLIEDTDPGRFASHLFKNVYGGKMSLYDFKAQFVLCYLGTELKVWWLNISLYQFYVHCLFLHQIMNSIKCLIL